MQTSRVQRLLTKSRRPSNNLSLSSSKNKQLISSSTQHTLSSSLSPTSSSSSSWHHALLAFRNQLYSGSDLSNDVAARLSSIYTKHGSAASFLRFWLIFRSEGVRPDVAEARALLNQNMWKQALYTASTSMIGNTNNNSSSSSSSEELLEFSRYAVVAACRNGHWRMALQLCNLYYEQQQRRQTGGQDNNDDVSIITTQNNDNNTTATTTIMTTNRIADCDCYRLPQPRVSSSSNIGNQDNIDDSPKKKRKTNKNNKNKKRKKHQKNYCGVDDDSSSDSERNQRNRRPTTPKFKCVHYSLASPSPTCQQDHQHSPASPMSTDNNNNNITLVEKSL